MRFALLSLLLLSLLILGCTSEQPKPSPSAAASPSKKPLVEIGEASVLPSPTPVPKPVTITGKVIGNVTNVKNLTATIIWATNMKSNSFVEWGLDDNYGNTTGFDDNITAHRVNITGLQYLRNYHFRVLSCAGDVCNKSGDYNFTTPHRVCPPATSYITDGDFCMDNFESTIMQGKAVSTSGSVPSIGISKAVALAACEAVGKRLCSSGEFSAACNIDGIRTGDIGQNECNVRNSSYIGAGYAYSCISAEGVHDLIGNLWEWVSDIVTEKTPFYEGLVDRDDILAAGQDYVLPRQAGYQTELRGNDYYYNLETTRSAMIGKGIVRGGYYASNTLGGCWAFEVGVPLEGDPKVGFRCCS